jgi:hypothetical protein
VSELHAAQLVAASFLCIRVLNRSADRVHNHFEEIMFAQNAQPFSNLLCHHVGETPVSSQRLNMQLMLNSWQAILCSRRLHCCFTVAVAAAAAAAVTVACSPGAVSS